MSATIFYKGFQYPCRVRLTTSNITLVLGMKDSRQEFLLIGKDMVTAVKEIEKFEEQLPDLLRRKISPNLRLIQDGELESPLPELPRGPIGEFAG